jgi:uncharacterized protein YkwD
MPQFRLPAALRIGAIAVMGLLLCAAGPADRLADFGKRALATHNIERTRLGLKPLAWSDALAANASQWAAHLTTLPELQHDESLDVEGENLWRGTKGYYTPENMVQLWIDEVKVFNNVPIPEASTTGDFEDVGHYTQLVWKTTTLVGCAVADTPDGDEVMVCRYMEGGNVLGEVAY